MTNTNMGGTKIELVCIASLVTVITFLEIRFGFFAAFQQQILTAFPVAKGYGLSLVGSGFIGLCIYSYRRRVDLAKETKTRLAIEKGFELYQICDAVTGLPNRVGFSAVLNERLATVETDPFTVLGVEICNYSTLSSVHGSQRAEQVEVEIAQHLSDLPGLVEFVSRGDQDKYYVIVPGPDTDERRWNIDSIVNSVGEFASAGIEAHGLKLQAYLTFATIELGGCSTVKVQCDAAEALQRLDFALFKARQRGQGAVEHFDDKMEAALNQRVLIEALLAEGIHKSQIVPYFQPFIDLESDQITGFEILARWEHPEHGLIMPVDFIPIAQDTGLLGALTLSILRQACVAAKNWPAHINMAINISPTDLSNEAMMKSFTEILHETGIDPNRLEIEITESAFVEEVDDITSAIAKLKELGVSVSIDDFGTGYSSLHHLRILPFDKIKIDQSFVKDMETNPESKAIVEMIIGLGKSLGLPITAEGIEDGQNRDLLKELGCSLGQGYLFAKAVPAYQVEELITPKNETVANTLNLVS